MENGGIAVLATNLQARTQGTLFQEEKALVSVGLLGFVIALFCGMWVLFQGSFVFPEGDMSKAFSFNAALGIFLISTAAVLPLSGMRPKRRIVFRRTFVLLSLYAYVVETVQHFRGVNPRFSASEAVLDNVLGTGFALVALLMVISYGYMCAHFFRKGMTERRPELILGIRYAAVAIFFSFAAGFGMSALQSSMTGGEDDLLWVHGLGFHALQLLPIVGWLAERTTFPTSVRRRLVHGAGLLFLCSLLLLGWQIARGESIFAWSALPIAAGASLLCIGVIAWALVRNLRTSLR